MSSLSRKVSNRVRGFVDPLPLTDFDTYDVYWESRTGYQGEPEIRTRWQFAVQKIPDGATVLDVGCGTGGFLSYLRSQRPQIQASGIDITEQGVAATRRAGFDAWVANLEHESIDGMFDYITCFETIEHVHEAERMLVAMRDAFSKQLIMSLPNIGHIEHRIRLALFGRFPNTTLVLHQKEHIRHWTVKDFTYWAGHFGLRVVDVQGQWGLAGTPWRRWPQLWAPQVVYTLERAAPESPPSTILRPDPASEW